MNRILSQNSNIEITNSRKIVDTRNRISHGYDSVSDDIIWAIIIREVKNIHKVDSNGKVENNKSKNLNVLKDALETKGGKPIEK